MWKCLKCGYDKGEFTLLGNGFIKCPNCATRHYIQSNGELILVGEVKDEK